MESISDQMTKAVLVSVTFLTCMIRWLYSLEEKRPVRSMAPSSPEAYA